MPHIRIRALSIEQIKTLGQPLCEQLAYVMQTPLDNFTVEKIDSQFFQNGKSVPGDAMIEIHWFDRGQNIQDLSAQKIIEIFRKLIGPQDLSVVFFDIPKNRYYENGKHF